MLKRNFIGTFLICCTFFGIISCANAKILTANEVSGEFNNVLKKEFDLMGNGLEAHTDVANKTIDLYQASDKLISFNYTDEYVEYDNRSAIITEETASNTFFDIIYIAGLVKSIWNLSGYSDKTISFDESNNLTEIYDEYGIYLETEPYSFGDSESYISGDFIKYFKISLDTDKVDKLVSDYGEDISDDNGYQIILDTLTPTLEAKSITEKSVTLYPEVSYGNQDFGDMLFCYIYKSTSEDGEYTILNGGAYNCSGEVGVVDDEVESNATYYYKAKLMNGNNYSNLVKVTTKGGTTAKSEAIENPKTGAFTLKLSFISCILIGTVVFLRYIKRHTVFRKI